MATVVLDADLGLIAGFAASLFCIVVRSIFSHTASLGVLPKTGEIVETAVYQQVDFLMLEIHNFVPLLECLLFVNYKSVVR